MWKGRKGMKRSFFVVATALAALAIYATPAFATGGTTIQWGGNGSENLPCSGASTGCFSPAKGIIAAALIDGVVR